MSIIMYYLEPPASAGYELRFARMTAGASGFDLQANIGDARIIDPGRRFSIRTGLYLSMPLGVEAQVRPRSGLVRDHGIMGAFGSIDSDYRGEIAVTLLNFGHEPYKVLPGDRIGQLVFAPVFIPGQTFVPNWCYPGDGKVVSHPALFRVSSREDLGDTTRGTGGFGSTGR